MPTSIQRISPRPRNLNIFPPITQKHAQAIGYLVTEWAIVDGILSVLIATLLRSNTEVTHAVSAEMSPLHRFNTITALLYATREQEWVDEWISVSAPFERLRIVRNDVVHSSWHVVHPSHWSYRATARGKVTIKFVELSTERVNQTTEEIKSLSASLVAFNYNVAVPAAKTLAQSPIKPPLSPSQSRKALDLAQARTAKRAKKEKDRQESRKNAPPKEGN